jgi:hypothetical protein
LVGTNCNILKNSDYGNEMEEFQPEYKAWNNRFVWSQQIIKKLNGNFRWINFFNIIYGTEEEKHYKY